MLGLNDTINRNIPTLIPSLVGIRINQISCGGLNSIVKTSNSQVYSFGDNGVFIYQ